MFDIGFWELVMIGVIALLVVGPERLPKLARTAGVYYGKARRFVSTVRADVERELKSEELRRVMDEQARSSGIHEIVEESKSALNETKSAVEELDRDMRRQQEAMKASVEGGEAATEESGAADKKADERLPDKSAEKPKDEPHRSDDG